MHAVANSGRPTGGQAGTQAGSEVGRYTVICVQAQTHTDTQRCSLPQCVARLCSLHRALYVFEVLKSYLC